jgi:site-specific recombinase XerC
VAHQRARGRDRVASSATPRQQSTSEQTDGESHAALTGQHWGIMARIQEAGLSARTAAHARAVLRAVLQDAQRSGRVQRNVAQLAHAPHVEAPDPMVLSPNEALTMIDALSDPGLRRLAMIAAFCGLRQSEELHSAGLTWTSKVASSASVGLFTASAVATS